MSPDIINGFFELVGTLCLASNIRLLYRQKQVRGVTWQVSIFFTLWGIWNLFYYPSLGQWFSFSGGVLIAAANIIWITMAFIYRKR